MFKDAVFSQDDKKRFALIRDWTASGPKRTLNLIGVNPSKAGYIDDDPTIRKGIGFATRWGYTRLVMTNLNPIIATDPWDLPYWKGFDQENLRYLKEWIDRADLVVAAWGSLPRAVSDRIALPEYTFWLREQLARRPIYCIGMTSKYMPRHPSRAAYTRAPVPFWWNEEADTASDGPEPASGPKVCQSQPDPHGTVPSEEFGEKGKP